ncbi:N-acetyltransferase domain-containing protein [Chloropicon primus]|uniref:N-acetyltransferase domain-containing protein n=1 Tax=Chloropicon primus TaxID=1764295 RepID=A0A5B8MRL4_9CHLO|nr:hypothetical protein A3770_06p45680 [Chloropicon primus]UPR01270.1 N-acetyltransferase domain-containing protein [Chloropicon primus]|mmetsp:Transcript_6750/g.19746  ORF Transcript_6750/g.19746 Transcript_6750/m.19746 type:complete len:321 (+) Transcript_6750:129-1091(+)|eukprot:QDZ22050.1 hypothetical protein A3770_06p45680 [Chloropicon primus]
MDFSQVRRLPRHATPLRRQVTSCSFLRTRTKVVENVVRARQKTPRFKRGGLEIYEAELGDYQMVSRLLVEAFYTDTRVPENNLSPMQKRGLERDQNLDLRARYGRASREGGGVIQSTILVASKTETTSEGDQVEEEVGCVALGTTPFVGSEAQLNIRDLYAYSNRVGATKFRQVEDDGTCLRPVVANLAVLPKARRKGIAKKLMREAEEVAKAWGYQELWLLVEKDNPKARKLYGGLGFKAVKEEPDDAYKLVEGRIEKLDTTNIYMKKSLRGFPLQQLENADWVSIALLAGLGSALTQDDVRELVSARLLGVSDFLNHV